MLILLWHVRPVGQSASIEYAITVSFSSNIGGSLSGVPYQVDVGRRRSLSAIPTMALAGGPAGLRAVRYQSLRASRNILAGVPDNSEGRP